MLTGLDVLIDNDFAPLKGQKLGLLTNAGTLDQAFRYTADIFRQAPVDLRALFGPQHGLWGHTQDNMIEWEGDATKPTPIYSLYGEHREPSDAMLDGLDNLVVDLPDIGARYYTFIWTMALAMKACARNDIRVTVLDRPNPIEGTQVEGTVLDPNFSSFVGLYPLPTRHGMTVGEIARYLQQIAFPDCRLDVIPIHGWDRNQYADQTGLPWAMPSPNMPTVDTAIVYPGMCLLEGTNLSEGRGTTRPFEMFGAPWVDGWTLANQLNALDLPGVHFRPVEFQPTFQKHAGKLCGGCFIHVTERNAFSPVLTAIAVLQACAQGTEFKWNDPPYEYESIKLPIDILAGNEWLRPSIEGQLPIETIRERLRQECQVFEPIRQEFLLY